MSNNTKRDGKGMAGVEPTFVIYDEIDSFVDSHPNMRFNGWDVEVLRFDPMGWSKTNGLQVDGTWYTKKVVSPNTRTGLWEFSREDTYVSNK